MGQIIAILEKRLWTTGHCREIGQTQIVAVRKAGALVCRFEQRHFNGADGGRAECGVAESGQPRQLHPTSQIGAFGERPFPDGCQKRQLDIARKSVATAKDMRAQRRTIGERHTLDREIRALADRAVVYLRDLRRLHDRPPVQGARFKRHFHAVVARIERLIANRKRGAGRHELDRFQRGATVEDAVIERGVGSDNSNRRQVRAILENILAFKFLHIVELVIASNIARDAARGSKNV